MLDNSMSDIPSTPINEGISFLWRVAPSALETLRNEHPSLAEELKLGIPAGTSKTGKGAPDTAIIREKAQIMIAVLSEASVVAQKALVSLSRRVNRARVQRLASQVLVLVGSSSSLGTLALRNNPAAVISAVLTVVAALGNLLAEYQERLLNPRTGNIYDAFQRLSECVYKTRTLATDLALALKYEQENSEIKQLIIQANVLCERLNDWLIKLVYRTDAASPSLGV